MILYREHRGSFAEAMATTRQFESEAEMKEYIVNQTIEHWGKPMYSAEDITISREHIFDERNGWDTHYVRAPRFGSEDGTHCIGMCAIV